MNNVPEGWKLVPIVPTLEMKNAGWNDVGSQNMDPESLEMESLYAALIAAAPLPAVAPICSAASNIAEDGSSVAPTQRHGDSHNGMNFAVEIASAQAEMETWSEEKKSWMQLEGTDPYYRAPTPGNASDAPIDYCKRCHGDGGEEYLVEGGSVWHDCEACDGSGNATPVAAQGDVAIGSMTAKRAAFFMERFKREEKLLGPNEQAALKFVIEMLEAAPVAAPGNAGDAPGYDDDDREKLLSAIQMLERLASGAVEKSTDHLLKKVGTKKPTITDAYRVLKFAVPMLRGVFSKLEVPAAMVAPDLAGERDKLLRDIKWRIGDVKNMLMGQDDRTGYGCDEWSVPVVNLATAIRVIDAALASRPQISAPGGKP